MNKNNSTILIAVTVMMTTFLFASVPSIEAHPHPGTTEADSHTHEPQTEIISIDGTIGIQKTILTMHASKDNTLPWGFVEGKIANPVLDYPVIIQIYDVNGEATHFAQTNANEDGTYEYKFRVRNVDNGEAINIFEGEYVVKVFKVVYLDHGSNQV